MNIAQIEINLQKLIAVFNKESFIYDLLLAYGLPKASVTRLKKGSLNLSKTEGEISWKKKLFFRAEYEADLHLTISQIAKTIKHKERFVVLTDYKTLLAIDTKTGDKLDITLNDLPKHYDFFLPWAGMEKAQHANENPADVKAAVKMAKLFDEIKKDNPDDSPDFIHDLNVFLSRLLFCFFAEDTHIFADNQFTNAIASHTQTDGSDLNTYLDNFFTLLNTPENERNNLPEYLKAFPFVNGGLFKDEILSPKFSRGSRAAILSSGEQNWSAINPDIFGSMFQAVIGAEQRGSLGQHYTSVPNIMKVIEPLFLNDLYEGFEKGKSEPRKLMELLARLSQIKIFDPACGSGNFLIIAYKELRILEMKIIQQLLLLQKAASGFERKHEQIALFDIPKSQLTLAASFQVELFSRIQLSQFYGIEIDDFAGEIAKLALWLSEHQMNVEFLKEFGQTSPTLPLREAGKIVQGNACRLDWEVVCPKKDGDEIYILGNPPYRGKKEQTIEQKSDLKFACKNLDNFKNLDFIACWFFKASEYITNDSIKCAFVSTNSICQGEQIGLLWPYIYEKNIEIYFGYTSFMWKNSAQKNAGVAVIIVGIQSKSKKEKHLYISLQRNEIKKLSTNKINPYLSIGSDTIVQKRSTPLSKISDICNGSMANDNGGFFLDSSQFETLHINLKKFYKKVIGAKEFFHKIDRYVLWLDDDNKIEALRYQEIREIIHGVKEYRLKSTRNATRKLAAVSHRFGEVRYKTGNALIIPGLSAEKREYIPIGFITDDWIVTNLAQVVYDVEPWLFGVISSKINNNWVRSTSGYFKKDVRYSPILSYNTFPLPPISTQRKNEITQSVFRILEEREKHTDKTLAQLYDPDKMPKGLREAHRQNDIIIEKCYRSTPFSSDEERLAYLFKLYEKMIAEEKAQGTLFAKEKKTRKKKK